MLNLLLSHTVQTRSVAVEPQRDPVTFDDVRTDVASRGALGTEDGGGTREDSYAPVHSPLPGGRFRCKMADSGR